MHDVSKINFMSPMLTMTTLANLILVMLLMMIVNMTATCITLISTRYTSNVISVDGMNVVAWFTEQLQLTDKTKSSWLVG